MPNGLWDVRAKHAEAGLLTTQVQLTVHRDACHAVSRLSMFLTCTSLIRAAGAVMTEPPADAPRPKELYIDEQVTAAHVSSAVTVL